MAELRRERQRRQFRNLDKGKIVERVIKFFKQCDESRQLQIDMRLQRNAKYRQWTEGSDEPWEDASDAAIPDMLAASLKEQDTLHNAAMSIRPMVVALATEKTNKDKQDAIDNLQDYQFFVEQPGENILGVLIEHFVNDGSFVAEIPWIDEERDVSNSKTFPPIPEGEVPLAVFQTILAREFPGWRPQNQDGEGWDWKLTKADDAEAMKTVAFYANKDETEMVMRERAVVYSGPRVLPKAPEDVLASPRAANLQIPGPSNPGGASYVILVDHPTIDEVRRLQKSGFYDQVSAEQLRDIQSEQKDQSRDEEQLQTDAFQGKQDTNAEPEVAHRPLTRLKVYDCYNEDKNSLSDDVIWWVLLEPKLLLKAKALTEMYPSSPPRRPLAEAQRLPVLGRREGIGILEQSEGLHDLKKEIIDQVVDFGTLQNMPFGFYRPSSSMKNEVLRPSPGDLYPLSDPSKDISFPQFSSNSQNSAFNLFGLAEQMGDKSLSMSDLSFGRVPYGKSSALRTSGNMEAVTSQGESRPQRILRRFFGGLAQIWQAMHDRNIHFLPDGKKYRVAGYLEAREDPYQTIDSRSDIEGIYQFDFRANVMNSSKEALQENLDTLAPYLLSSLSIQAGIVNAENIYRFLRDRVKAAGQETEDYLTEPAPGAHLPRIWAAEALSAIIQGQIPHGVPAEGALPHLQRLAQFRATEEEWATLGPESQAIFATYFQQVQELAQQEMQQQQLAQQAAAQGGPPGQPGAPPQGGGAEQFGPLGPNELADETLPGAKGAVQ